LERRSSSSSASTSGLEEAKGLLHLSGVDASVIDRMTRRRRLNAVGSEQI